MPKGNAKGVTQICQKRKLFSLQMCETSPLALNRISTQSDLDKLESSLQGKLSPSSLSVLNGWSGVAGIGLSPPQFPAVLHGRGITMA